MSAMGQDKKKPTADTPKADTKKSTDDVPLKPMNVVVEGVGPNENITLNIARELLLKVEVRDAMNWARASSGDSRFANILRVMSGDEIWRLWTKRDMSEVYINDELPWWAEKAVDMPRWKVVYLWYRLTYTVYQKANMSSLNELSYNPAFTGGIRYPDIFERNVNLKHFNVFTITVSDASFDHNFNTVYNQQDLFENIPDEQNIKTFKKYRRIIHNISVMFKEIIKQKKIGIFNAEVIKLAFENGLNENSYDWLSRFPRNNGDLIIVAAPICASCGAPSPRQQCSCPCTAPYCDRKCQAEHHE